MVVVMVIYFNIVDVVIVVDVGFLYFNKSYIRIRDQRFFCILYSLLWEVYGGDVNNLFYGGYSKIFYLVIGIFVE